MSEEPCEKRAGLCALGVVLESEKILRGIFVQKGGTRTFKQSTYTVRCREVVQPKG